MFPGNPHDHSPCSSTPAGPVTRYGTKGQRTRHGPRTKAQRGLPTVANFGAQSHGFWSRCLRLEVEDTRHRARLASGCWSQLCRTGFDPQGFYERFLNWNSSSFPELHGELRFALFSHHWLPPFGFAGRIHWPQFSRHSPLATRHYLLRPSPAGYSTPTLLTPTADLAKTKRGPISTSGPFLSVWHQTGRSLRKNQSVCPRSRRWLSRDWRTPLPVWRGYRLAR